MRWAALLLLLPCCAELPPALPAPPEAAPAPSEAEQLAARRQQACAGPVDTPARPELVRPAVVAEGFVGAIEVEGLARVPKDRVLATMKTTVGSALNPKQLADDVIALWQLAELEDIAVHARGPRDNVTLVVTVRELPLVGRVFVDGADRELLGGLYDALGEAQGKPYLRHQAYAQTQRLEEQLLDEGYLRAKVELRRRRPAPGLLDLCYALTPGPRATVAGIDITGNEAIGDAELRALIPLASAYAPSALERGVVSITGHYLDRGYLLANVAEPRVEVSDDGREVRVSLAVTEGPQFRVGKVDVEGPPSSHPALQTQPGAVFSRKRLVEDVEMLERALREPREVIPETRVDEGAQRVDIVLRVR